MLTLDDLLASLAIPPAETVVMRHTPEDKALQRHFGWLMRERRDLRDAYHSMQFGRGEAALRRAGWLVSCLGDVAGQALVVGIDRVVGQRQVDLAEELAGPAYRELADLGTTWPRAEGPQLKFDLAEVPFAYAGKMVIDWPGGDRSWFRRAEQNRFEVRAILTDREAAAPMPDWRVLNLTWAELRLLPNSWAGRLAEWRGIYLIWDQSTGKNYVGSAGGAENILGRWRNYAQTGHGGNLGLIGVNPANLRFSIVERTSPDTPPDHLVALENGWKVRLSSRTPHGNNRN